VRLTLLAGLRTLGPAMAQRVLIVPDKFKGTLAADAVAAAIGRGWHRASPEDRLDLLPMSDGGDGFGRVTSRLLGARGMKTRTVDAAHRPCVVTWWWAAGSQTAIIESANVIGLAMLPPGRFHPFDLDTFGLGKLLRAAAERGARRCLIGIGGSATNDAGFGLARALGWKFRDARGGEITRWTGLAELADLEQPPRRSWFEELTVVVDVQNPLLGRSGATRIYGPQKGLRLADFKPAERALGRLAAVAKISLGQETATARGAGAAGGLGFGLATFANGKLEAGYNFFTRAAGLEERLKQANLVITGEGSIDRSTLMGKGVGQVARRCHELELPCLGLAGIVTPRLNWRRSFTKTHALTSLTDAKQARTRPGYWLARLAESVARSWPRKTCAPGKWG